jgi:hypothetical protein
MPWTDDALDQLVAADRVAYYSGGRHAAEPASLACLALVAWSRIDDAWRIAATLSRMQNHDGSVGVTEDQSEPGWPTAWAILAWRTVLEARFSQPLKQNLEHGSDWLLATEGEKIDQEEAEGFLGHRTELLAWPWIQGTHSWIEPTAVSVLALKAIGLAKHARTREAVQMLLDRQLPTGGCNYGNTIVLGQRLLPHVQPSGLALLALAGETTGTNRIQKSLHYLTAAISRETPTASLCWAVMGLTAHGRRPAAADEWLATAWRRTLARDRSPYKLALLALAASSDRCPLMTSPVQAGKA